MDYAAIDLHKSASQVRIVTDVETIDCRIPTTRDRLRTLFEIRPRMRILLEAAAESEWVARELEARGHDVIVADPNYTPMYGERSRRVKTDRRDVAALAEACPARDDTEAIDANVAVAAVAEDLATRRSFVLSHFARFTSRGSPAASDGDGNGPSSSRARPSSTARL